MLYSLSFPERRRHRVLRSAIGEMRMGNDRFPIPRCSVPSPTRDTQGRIEAMALYAGESVAAGRAILPAADVLRELVDGAEALLGRWR